MHYFFRRRKFIINKDLQYSLLVISLFYVFLVLIILGSVLFIPAIIQLEHGDYDSHEAVQAANNILYLHSKFWPAVLLALVLIGLHSIRTSHQIAGPLYRFNLLFESIKEGTLPKHLRVRRGDYLNNEVEMINQMLETLRTKVLEIQEAQGGLTVAISECKDVVNHTSKEEMTQRMKDLLEKGDQLGEKLAYFKIAS